MMRHKARVLIPIAMGAMVVGLVLRQWPGGNYLALRQRIPAGARRRSPDRQFREGRPARLRPRRVEDEA